MPILCHTAQALCREAEGIRLKSFRHDESGIDLSDKLNAKSGFNTVLPCADKLAYTVGDFVVCLNSGDVYLLGDEAKAAEGNVLSVNG